MNTNDPEDLKILIDALKYTSNIIVNITNKLTEQDEKIERLESNINKIYKILGDGLNSNSNLNQSTKTVLNTKDEHNKQDKNNKHETKSNIQNYIQNYSGELENQMERVKQNNLDSFVVEKTKYKTDIKNNQEKTLSGINLKDRNQIDKLINSIIKRKKLLSDIIEDNKEKSLLTDYNTVNEIIEGEDDDNNIDNNNTNVDFSIKTAKTINTNEPEEKAEKDDDTKTGNNDILKTVRKRSNFAKRF